MKIAIDHQRMLNDLRALSQFGRCGDGVERRALSDVDLEARQWLLGRMLEAGLDAEIDGVGNVIGRTSHARRILIGSHTDTVPQGGWLDGSLGVIYGLEIARAVQAQNSGLGIEVVSLSDEEGHFSALLGSRAFCGDIDPESYCDKTNSVGEPLGAALARHGLRGRPIPRLTPAVHAAYLEAHIEQGPILDDSKIEIGVVTDIVGLRECTLVFSGEANHAGTTPMAKRRNASAALIGFGAGFDHACRRMDHPHTVWNIARLLSEPLASNVVPSLASCTVQFRSTDERILDTMSALIETEGARAAAEFNAGVSITQTTKVSAVPMDQMLSDEIERAACDLGLSAMRMPSGAGHDAMIFAPHVPTAMLFIPSENGISHSTFENSSEPSLKHGLAVLARSIERIADKLAGEGGIL